MTVLAGNAEHMDPIAEAVQQVPGIEVVNVSDRTFLIHLGGKIEVALKTPLKTRDDLSMAYTPGRRAGVVRDRGRPVEGLEPDDQAEHGRRRQRRHGRARARRHRPRGRPAGHGGQGDAVQGVRRRRRLPDLPRDQGRGRDRRDREGDRARVRRDQPRGHLGAAVLRDRGPAARRARHPRLPRRPARDRDRHPRRAEQRGRGRRQAAGGPSRRRHRRRRRRRRRDEDAARRRRPRRRRLRPRGRRLRRPAGARPRRPRSPR